MNVKLINLGLAAIIAFSMTPIHSTAQDNQNSMAADYKLKLAHDYYLVLRREQEFIARYGESYRGHQAEIDRKVRRQILILDMLVNDDLQNNFNITGNWRANPGGILVLSQSGKTVTGTYNNGSSTLRGTLDGNVLKGTFQYNNQHSGEFTLTFTRDGHGFTGSWSNNGGSNRGPWSGSRIWTE